MGLGSGKCGETRADGSVPDLAAEADAGPADEGRIDLRLDGHLASVTGTERLDDRGTGPSSMGVALSMTA